jgi:hypothetical protein
MWMAALYGHIRVSLPSDNRILLFHDWGKGNQEILIAQRAGQTSGQDVGLPESVVPCSISGLRHMID